MKHILFFLLVVLLVLNYNLSFGNYVEGNNKSTQQEKSITNSLTIVSSQELYPLANAWGNEYKKRHSDVDINILNSGSENLTANENPIYIIPENLLDEQGDPWRVILGRDAIVPVVNARNPLLKKILSCGISSRSIHQLLTEQKPNWGILSDSQESSAIHFYMTDTKSLISKLANFSQTDPEVIRGKVSVVSGGLASYIQRDIYSIGFCKLTDILEATNDRFKEGIQLLPIDKNENGLIDNFENIYSNPSAFTRGVWVGKYPAALCDKIYAVSSSKPADKTTLDFLKWIQTDGQLLLNQNGFCSLAISERQSNIENLSAPILAEQNNKSTFTGIWLVTAVLLFIFLLIWRLFRVTEKKKTFAITKKLEIIPTMNENSLAAPKGFYFDKSHTWAFMEKEGLVKIGIDDFLQHTTGQLTSVILKEPGEAVRKGEKILTISHNGKKLNIHAPLSGTIKDRNRSLLIDSTLLNCSPYSDGWVYLIEPKNWLKENRFLFMSEKYLEWISDELTRLKDFVAMEVKSSDYELSHVILQDGGEINDNILADLDPKIWEDFQVKFLDNFK